MKHIHLDKIKSYESTPKIVNIFSEKEIKKIILNKKNKFDHFSGNKRIIINLLKKIKQRSVAILFYFTWLVMN